MWMVGLGATRLSREEPHHPRRPALRDSLLVGHPGLPRSEADIRFIGRADTPVRLPVRCTMGFFNTPVSPVRDTAVARALKTDILGCIDWRQP
jgi:hypothetical protein